jgi:hypothetical protein
VPDTTGMLQRRWDSCRQSELPDKEKLATLQRLDEFCKWGSLDERRDCLSCVALITGREIQVVGDGRPSRLIQPAAGGREPGRCCKLIVSAIPRQPVPAPDTKIRSRPGCAMWRNTFGGRAPHFQGHRNLTDKLIGLLTDCYHFVALHVVAMQTNDSGKEMAKC